MTTYIDYLESLSKQQLMVLLARQRQEETQGIAIVGMGCRLPGGIGDPGALWAAVREGRIVPTESAGPPADSLGRPRWNLDAPDLAPLADRLRQGAYLENVDVFDAEYFGIPEQEAVHMDPQQRMLLEVTVQALADANLSKAALRDRRVGIFAGAGPVEYPYAWLRAGLPAGELSPHMSSGSSPSALSGRIALALGVSGPVITVDTASSSMLTAVHLAAQSLRRRECDVALVGVCNLLLSPMSTGILDRAGMLSPTGRSRPFTREADGHVRGEGCGVIVLKRYADSVTEEDVPYALVRGSAVHQHGDRPGMAVASARGQRAVTELALRDAGVEPADVQYVEAQANGSRLGAAVEAESLAESYGRTSPTAPPLHLGSCKANLGYLETASGAPGLMKTALALAHAEIPPQPGHDDLDPGIPWEGTALRCAAEPLPWPSEARRRRAGVSGFGFSGTNAHVVLESVPEGPPQAQAQAHAQAPAAPGPWLLTLSAHRSAALAGTAAKLHRHLREDAGWEPGAVCRTLAEGRDHHSAVRRAVVVHDRSGLLDGLAGMADGTGAAREGASDAEAAAHVFLDAPEAAGEPLRLALEHAGRPGLEPLGTRIRAHAEALDAVSPSADDGDRYVAWVLGWLDLLEAVGLTAGGGRFGGPDRLLLADAVTGGSTAGQVRDRRGNGAGGGDGVSGAGVSGARGRLPAASWETHDAGGTVTVRRRGGPAATTVKLAEVRPAEWLSMLADRYAAGARITQSALYTAVTPRPALLHLPGPVLTGRRHWPDHNNWS